MKIAIKIFFLVMLIGLGIFLEASAPVINNELAMTQMENSDELLVSVNTYNRVMPIVRFWYTVIMFVVAGDIAYDVYKLFKNEKEK